MTFSHDGVSVPATVIDQGPDQGLHLGPDQEDREAGLPRGRLRPDPGHGHAALVLASPSTGPHRRRATHRPRGRRPGVPSKPLRLGGSRRTAGSPSCGSAATEANRLSNSARASSATASRISSSLQPASLASSTRWWGGRSRIERLAEQREQRGLLLVRGGEVPCPGDLVETEARRARCGVLGQRVGVVPPLGDRGGRSARVARGDSSRSSLRRV